ncbi:MAG TPA: polyprenyl synthetase family protein [Candidatus Akkermansia intestinigallinarum]|uniref:Polyprenyl synthetase family protein n=1 Tax=Candidatus Akkermansia intestinigallinarum TaxID=2838431 RepID=A0A9D1VBI8_9BACT|nr:polyprenyl synthetase family protein [Candidatus Akkermansia intestinigallinarum]
MDIKELIKETAARVEARLSELLPSEDTEPAVLHKAMRYSIFAGGKRIRPLLCLEAAKACGSDAEVAMHAACALETLHTYTLIHDDLPCMDDDELRRGRPTNHKVFGEGMAVLAGDALLTEAFGMLALVPSNDRYDVRDYVAELAYRTGSLQLVGGQALDLEGEGRQLSLDELRSIHNGKTAALIVASLRLGGMAAACTQEQLEALTAFGRNMGLAFQIIDDILDITSSPEVLGKSIGKDAREQKATYPAIVGMERARAEARELTAAARAALDVFSPRRSETLLAINDYLLKRDY